MITLHLELNSRTPLYIQVIKYFKEQIASGSLEMGEEIPSRRELANKLKINPNTVQRAYKEMEEQRLIFTDGNMPSKVTQDENIVKAIRQNLLTDAIDEFITTAKTLQISLDELLPLVEENYRKEAKTND